MWEIIEIMSLFSGIAIGGIGIILLYKETKMYNKHE